MASDKIKRSKTEENDASEHTDPELVASIEKLQEVQDELEKLDEKASDEVLEVERKYNEIRRPIYDKRNEVIKTIPDFWLTAFLSHPVLSELLNEEDHEIFKHLESLDVCDFKDVKAGYSITFSFKTNPYFENSKLTKTFSFNDEGTTKITGATIKWKDGRLTSNGKAEESKGKKRSLSDESFFSWFGESEEHEVPGVIQDEVADMIKEELWGNPLKYFNNELSDDEMEGDVSEENDDDTDSSDDDNNDSMEENGN